MLYPMGGGWQVLFGRALSRPGQLLAETAKRAAHIVAAFDAAWA